MELRELRAGMLVWLPIGQGDKMLCRVRFLSRDYVSLQVMTATPEQVIVSGYGVGESINSTPLALTPAKASER